jgi:uncharacterized tellurite resistance protein B-like protein
VEFLKVLACLAWADEEVTTAELNFIKQFVREFDISGDEWMQVEMYLVEKVEPEEMKQVTRNFLSRIRRPRERRMLVDSVERLLGADRSLTDREREWMQDLQEVVAEGKRKAFVLDGLKSLLRIGGASSDLTGTTRDAELHDFIHNRVLFKLRRRLDPERLEMEGSPAKLKKLTLSAALLGRVGYVDKEFLPREKAFMEEVLHETWGVSLPLAKAVTEIAIEAVTQGADLYRLTKEGRRLCPFQGGGQDVPRGDRGDSEDRLHVGPYPQTVHCGEDQGSKRMMQPGSEDQSCGRENRCGKDIFGGAMA